MLLIKKWWDLSSVWVRQHWRWLVMVAALIIIYLFGKRQNRAELIQAKLTLRHYKQEKDAIIKAYETEKKLRQEAKQKYDNAMTTVREKFKNDVNSLNMKKEVEIRQKLKQAKNNPSEIDKILEDELGIKEHG
jgi:membrane-associated HD superfamily phosphohydrolase